MSAQYPSNVTDGRWQVLRGLLPKTGKAWQTAHLPAAESECNSVRQSNGLPMAGSAARFCQVEDGINRFLALASRRRLAKNS